MHVDIGTGNTGLQENLLVQLRTILEHARQGSYETRRRYARAGIRFVKWLADEFHVQRLANLHSKHLKSYADHLKSQGLSPKYIETELSAVRWIHGQIAAPRNRIDKGPGANAALDVIHDSRVGVHREWSKSEQDLMVGLALDSGRDDIARIIRLACATGLRLNEVCTLRRHQAEEAIRTGVLRVKGKNGKVREIPVNSPTCDLLLGSIQEVKRGDYLFCPSHRSIPAFKADVEDFIRRNREIIQAPDRVSSAHNVRPGAKSALSMHGLRYKYVQDEYHRLVSLGISRPEAERQVMRQVGHERRSEIARYGVPVDVARQQPLIASLLPDEGRSNNDERAQDTAKPGDPPRIRGSHS